VLSIIYDDVIGYCFHLGLTCIASHVLLHTWTWRERWAYVLNWKKPCYWH